MRQVEIAGIALEATTGAPLVVLQETDEPHRAVPIFIGGTEAAAIGLALAGETPDRPLAHDVMAELVEVLDARVDRVEVTELRDGAFLAAMTVSGPGGDQRLDTRPSDAIALAVRLDAPLYVSDAVLEAAGSVRAPDGEGDDEALGTAEVLDADAIEAAVAAFRAELDDVDPAFFDLDHDAELEVDPSRGASPGPNDDPDELESWGD
jgi:bifunctional DNase/RNase